MGQPDRSDFHFAHGGLQPHNDEWIHLRVLVLRRYFYEARYLLDGKIGDPTIPLLESLNLSWPVIKLFPFHTFCEHMGQDRQFPVNGSRRSPFFEPIFLVAID